MTEVGLNLSRRERQIMDSLHRRGEAAVADILADLPDPPTDSSLRALLRILARKGLVRRRADGRRHLYRPAQTPAAARQSAVRHVLRTFFQGSRERAIRAVLADSDARLSDDELDLLEALVRDAKGRP